MPLGPYRNWDECIKDQRKKGKSQVSAEKICGYIESQTRKAEEK